MSFVDLESFRSKYSDLTVTTVPKQLKTAEDNANSSKSAEVLLTETPLLEPSVEITRIARTVNIDAAPLAAQPKRSKLANKTAHNAAAYANEYKLVMAKLERTKYINAQMKLMSAPNSGPLPLEADSNMDAMFQQSLAANPSSFANDNIEIKYNELLQVISEMRCNLPPSIIGVRAPKDRLVRDIAKARVLARECLMLLNRDCGK